MVEDAHEGVSLEGLFGGCFLVVEIKCPQTLVFAFIDSFEERAIEVSFGTGGLLVGAKS